MNLEVQCLRDHHGRGRDHRVHAHVHDHELHLNNSFLSAIMVVTSGGSQLVTHCCHFYFEFDSVPFSISSFYEYLYHRHYTSHPHTPHHNNVPT
jgi:hypothetical protein